MSTISLVVVIGITILFFIAYASEYRSNKINRKQMFDDMLKSDTDKSESDETE